MKILISLLMSLNISILACEIEGITVHELIYHDLTPVVNGDIIAARYIKVSERDFLHTFTPLGFDYQDCQDAIYQIDFLQNGQEYTVLTTLKDTCDGGHATGYVLKSSDQYIANIISGKIACF